MSGAGYKCYLCGAWFRSGVIGAALYASHMRRKHGKKHT